MTAPRIDATPAPSPTDAGASTSSDHAVSSPQGPGESTVSSSNSFPTRGADYEPGPLEARWQAAWRETRAFAVPPPQDEREPAYVFAGCPFTSGDAHMGHIRSYTIADAYARFLRARGRAVLFSLGFDSFGLPAELEALRRGISPQQWVARCCERMRGQFEALGYSCDWERTFVSSEPEHYRWTQWLFLAMLERGLVYRREAQVSWCDSCQTVLATLQAEDGTCWRCHSEVRFVRLPQWFMRITAYAQDNERGLESLPGWDKAAVGSQRAVLGRVDGVELDAATFDGGALTVFTPHPEALAQAAFVALSPSHPDVDRWIAEPAVAEQLAGMREAGWRREDREAEQVPVVQTGALVTVPGVAGMLPIVISPLVDARFGPTAALGIPELRPDRRLDRPAATCAVGGRVEGRQGLRHPATGRALPRPRLRDLTPARVGGADPADPLPRVRDGARALRGPAGAAPRGPADHRRPRQPAREPPRLPRDLLPALRRPGEERDGHDRLPRRRDVDVDADLRAPRGPLHADVQSPRIRPLAAGRADRLGRGRRRIHVRPAPRRQGPAGPRPAAPLPAREPFTKALMHQMIRLEGRKMSKHLGNVVDPNELVATVGADTVRLAVLHAASPGRIFNWNEQPVRYCQIFLKKLFGYAEGRLRAWGPKGGEARIDTSEKLRRRLANWCAVACAKVAENFEGLEMQRAAHNTMLLLTRIQDFEQRALHQRGGELEPADREAIVAALLLLTQMLAPLTPHIAEELWSLAGHTTLVSTAPWPDVAVPRQSERAVPAGEQKAVPTSG